MQARKHTSSRNIITIGETSTVTTSNTKLMLQQPFSVHLLQLEYGTPD
jgi:hypothetical protein